MREKINKILFPFNVLMTAFGFINFGKDLVPGLIKWSEFILKALDFFKIIRNFILFPVAGFISIFNFEMQDWFKTYFFLGILSYNTYNYSYKKICGHFSSSSIITLIFGPERLKVFLVILYNLFLWPLHIFALITHYYEKGYKRQHNVYTLWGKYIFWVFFSIILIVFLNWTYLTFIDELLTQ